MTNNQGSWLSSRALHGFLSLAVIRWLLAVRTVTRRCQLDTNLDAGKSEPASQPASLLIAQELHIIILVTAS